MSNVVKLSSIMDVSEVAQSGTPLSELLQKSLREARARLDEPDGGCGEPPDAPADAPDRPR